MTQLFLIYLSKPNIIIDYKEDFDKVHSNRHKEAYLDKKDLLVSFRPTLVL